MMTLFLLEGRQKNRLRRHHLPDCGRLSARNHRHLSGLRHRPRHSSRRPYERRGPCDRGRHHHVAEWWNTPRPLWKAPTLPTCGACRRTEPRKSPSFCSSMPRTSIFLSGKAINPAHQNPDLPITFGIKIRLVQELSEYLEKMGKQIKVSYF